MIAALFVQPNGVYADLPGVDVWDESCDARLYPGPHAVVAHPPCERWGRYWSGGPSAKVKRKLGDDGGCFESALGCDLPYLIWGKAEGKIRLEAGYHSIVERAMSRTLGGSAMGMIKKSERSATPIAFRDILLAMARSVR
jgi:hypothetical protein